MAININTLQTFANSLRSLAQQIDSLTKQGLQDDSGSQNSGGFSAVLDNALSTLSPTQSSQAPAAQADTAAIPPATASVSQCQNMAAQLTQCRCSDASQGSRVPDKSTPLPSWLAAAQPAYEADQAHWSAVEAKNRAFWANPEALRKLQETYSPDTSVHKEAVNWLDKNTGTTYWDLSAPHVMETGKLLGSPLPDYLQVHYARYQQLAQGDTTQKQQALWKNNPEALRKLQETYHPDVKVRQESLAWLEKNIGANWKVNSPNVMETAKMLTALGEPSSSLAA